MSTASYIPQATVNSSQTIYPKCFRVSLMHQTSAPLQKLDINWQSSTLTTRPVKSIHLHLSFQTCLHRQQTLITLTQTYSYLQINRCVMDLMGKDRLISICISEYQTSQKMLIVMSSTADPPLEWFIDRYYIKTDKDSGIVNDPNGWFADPRDIVTCNCPHRAMSVWNLRGLLMRCLKR